jgi:iron complex outermembrane recepter protein
MSKFSKIRSALLGGAGLVVFVAAPAWAQADSQAMETVVVTGIRGSLQRALDIKRESLGLVDAVSMEDIGKFPDSNLAAALMRIPGVTVTRAGQLGGTVTTGEATEVTVRGFGPSFNETLFEGRRIPSGVGQRAFDFSGLSADMVSELRVLKSPDASLSAGAIGATINVIYPKPFDFPGLKVAAAISGTYAPDDGRITPNGNFLVSDTFLGGKLGVLVAGAFSSLSTTQQQFSNWGWIGQMMGTTPVWFTQDYSIDYNYIREEKKNARLAVQWQPNDRLLVTLDANYARDNVHEQQWAYAIWNNFGEMSNIVTSEYGTITSYNRHAPTDFDANENWGVQQTYDVGINFKLNITDKFTLVGDFDQALSVLNPGRNHFSAANMDVGYGGSQGACTVAANPNCPTVNADGTPNGGVYSPWYSMNINVIQPGGHKIPYYVGYGPNGNAATSYNNNADFLGFNSTLASDGIMGSHVMVVTQSLNRMLVNQAKLEGQWKEDNLTVKFGASYVQDHYKLDGYDSFWGNQWQIFSGYGPDSNNLFYEGMHTQTAQAQTGTYVNNPDGSVTYTPTWQWSQTVPNNVDCGTAPAPVCVVTGPLIANQGNPAGVHMPSSLFTSIIKIRDIPGWTTVASIPGLPKFSRADAYAYIGSLGATTSNGFNWYCCGVPTIYTNTNLSNLVVHDNNNYQQVFEDTYSFYVTANTDTMIGGLPLRINAGVRYEYTDVTSAGLFSPLHDMVIDAADHTAYDMHYDASTAISVPSSYQYLLPNLDLVLQASDDLQIRFDASRTLTRPTLNQMTPNTSYGGRTGSLTATSGNPNLKPFVSDNVDVSAEWYYAPNSYVSGTVYLKNVTNFIVNGTTSLTFPNAVDSNVVVDPYTGKTAVFALTSPKNGPVANVYGLELAWQHMFGDSGFGYQINGTIVQTDKNYNPYDLTSSSFAVTGLADSANFVAFYDKDGFEFRVAANWRDTYLDRFGQSQNGTSFGIEPTYVNTAWAIDLSTSYDFTDNITAYLTVNNLLDQAYSTRGRFPDQIVDIVAYGRRFTAGVHFKM